MLSRSHVVAAALLAVGLSACAPSQPGAPSSAAPTLPAFTTSATPTTSAPAQATDYTRLLVTAADLSDAEDTFTERHIEASPGGLPGASAFFVNAEDTRAISSTILVYDNPGTAATALKEARGTLGSRVTGNPVPGGVGPDSVMVRGADPDEAKDITVLMFTQGRALARLEFQSAGGDATTDGYVTTVGKMQQIALRSGLQDDN
ncbi:MULTISPECIES: hypothetical protein [Mycolicibacterium]|uniref:Lipoprotein n=1 Tax=Mycolicibacterium neoaurum TaxID=1795 RepID=A0AAV2WT09_MYCNE|nr:hypothetical protein [Mycolicibacterium neoaurum]QVI29006.1 hypothetical protein MN2019_06675 [Mycolicibacterium neoaurum]TLH57453.1 hypothetical protein C1S81_19380 [Mycolicibacterium neoaurum]CDQ45126.1 hypothetical protein BN1047_03014 [Mycolicibacterium neoaurum]CDQ47385.1 hypothetical protein BN1047_05306 [Mycolicibacterium neoaurum]SDC34060.1 hypothetical protein SAMN04488581_0584 [Mycolicibacterium neoaurum]